MQEIRGKTVQLLNKWSYEIANGMEYLASIRVNSFDLSNSFFIIQKEYIF